MITMKDISEQAGVSISTVSRVLNNSGKISKETRERVLSKASELYYRPGTVLQKLESQSYTIGFFVPDSGEFLNNDPHRSVEIQSARTEFETLGHRTILLFNQANLAAGDHALEAVMASAIDAAVVYNPFCQDKLGPLLAKAGIPYLTTNGRRGDWGNFVDYNNGDGARQATEHLLSLGHRAIGVLTGPLEHLVSMNRLEAHRATMERSGIMLNPDWTEPGEFTSESGWKGMHALLGRADRPTAVFAFSDNIALGALKALREAKLRVPEDVSLVGFDDNEIAQFTDPPLTTVSRFRFDINSVLVRTLLDLLRNSTVESVQISFKTNLVVRGTTGPVKVP